MHISRRFWVFAFWMIFPFFKKNWVLGYSWSTLLWHRCYYRHRSRDALSLICRIFKNKNVRILNCENPILWMFTIVNIKNCEEQPDNLMGWVQGSFLQCCNVFVIISFSESNNGSSESFGVNLYMWAPWCRKRLDIK